MSAAIPVHASVWFEIPVTDFEKAKAFYAGVLGNPLTDAPDGPNPMAMFAVQDMQTGNGGHLYPGRPAAPGTGPTIHLVVTDALEDALARVTEHGGQVVSPIITIPAGRFAYCLDPDGNSFGLFA